MKLLETTIEVFEVKGLVFEKIDQLKYSYLGATIKENNYWSVKIINLIYKV